MSRRKTEILTEKPVDLKSIIKKPITVSPRTTILDARDILLKYRISRLIVEKNKKPIGIVTEKDIARSLVISKKPLPTILIQDIMSKNLITITPDKTIYDCSKLMMQNGISSVIVIDQNGYLMGLVTKTDLVSTFLVQSTASLTISAIMTKKVITVSPDDSIFEVRSILLNNKISRVVVVKNKIPVGVITYRDFVPAKLIDLQREYLDPDERQDIAWNPYLNDLNARDSSYLLTFTASDIMTKNPFYVEADDVVYTAAILMIRHGISGLPVVKNKKLVGIVTKSDIVNVLAKKGKI